MKVSLSLCMSIVLMFWQTTTFAQKKPEVPKYINNVEGIKSYSLQNGLQVLLIPDASQSNMVVNIVYNVGSKHEGYGEKGMAHLLEHMLFKSTKKLGDIKKMLSEKGGNANGTTWYDRTNYYEIFPSTDDNLKWSIQMEADRMINATILQSDLDKEFSVVRNEFEIGENSPSGVLMERIISAGYLWHNYGNSTIGSKEDVERVKATSLRRFYEKYYQPDNATLVIAGKFDEKKALQYISTYFSVIPKPKRVLEVVYTVEPPQDGEKFVEIKRAGDSKSIGAMYHTVPYADKDYAALDALQEILTSDPSGYLYKSLVDTKKVASIWAFQPTVRDASFMYFGIEVPNDKDINESKNFLRDELDKVANLPYTEQDLQRAKTKILKYIENTKNNTISLAINLTEIIGAGDYRLVMLYRDAIEKLTLADIQRVAEKYFRSNNRTVGVFIPSKDEVRVKNIEYTKEQIAAITEHFKGKAPEKEVASFEASIDNIKKNFTEGKLSNGMKFGLVKKEVKGDKVQARFNLKVGNESDLNGKSFIGGMTASLLKSGTSSITKEQIQDKLDVLKSSVNFWFSGQTLGISISTYKNSFNETMAIVKDILLNANFPQNELEKSISEYKTYLEGSLNDPESVANNELDRMTTNYPKGSIYYTPTTQESIDELKSITRQQMVDFHKQIFGANNGFGSIIGDLSTQSVSQTLENTFGTWNAISTYSKIEPTHIETQKADKKILTPDKENATALGRINFKMNKSNPEYAAMLFANEMLGSGGFLTSRIPIRLREKEGISYGAGSYVSIPTTEDNAFWQFYAFLNPTKRDAVEVAVKEEISKVIATGFTQEEMTANLKSWLSDRKTSLGNDGYILNLTNNYLEHNIPLEDFDALETKVKALKIQDVNAVIKKYLSLEKLTSVYAGDFNKK